MTICVEKNRNRMAAVAAGLSLLVLAACTHSGSPTTNAASADSPQANASADTDAASDLPKVPFGNQPCRSLSADELKDLGIAKPVPAKPEPGREPDGLAFENTCDFGYQTLVYTTRSNYEDQKSNLRNPRHNAPADLPDAFYDTLGNLWFAKKGYYVGIPNNTADAVKEKMARVIAAKL
jgi:hypothetical protein